MATERDPGDGQDEAEANLERFNEAFYRSDPADLLMTRLQLLMLSGARRRELAELISPGISFAGVTFGESATSEAGEVNGPDERLDQFITVESQQLLHHSCDTALRLFLVHSSRMSVPWIALAGERNFARLKQTIRTEFVDGVPSPELIGYVCLGSRTPPADLERSRWDAAVEGISEFLRAFALCFLDDAVIYNAIKHGLGVTAGEAIAIVNAQQLGEGPSIEFPECTTWDSDGIRDWSLTTRWVDLAQSIGLTYAAIQLIDSMWKIGRFRTVGGPDADDLFFPEDLRPGDLVTGSRPPMRRMSWRLVSERRA